MKNFILFLLFLTAIGGYSQRLAFIEMEKIINLMPEYKAANEKIDEQVKIWQTEVETKFESVETLYQEYVKNERYLTDEEKLTRQNEIVNSEKQAKEYRETIFGKDGELQKLEEQTIKPLHDKILETAEKIAVSENYDYVFDKSIETNWIYLNPLHDLTEKVITELGLK